jgi:hypothetical protein
VRYLRDHSSNNKRDCQRRMLSAHRPVSWQHIWDSVDVDRSGNLKLEDVAVVMAKMKITCSKENLRRHFEKSEQTPFPRTWRLLCASLLSGTARESIHDISMY